MIDITEAKYSAMVNQAPDGAVLVDAGTLGFKEFNDTECKDIPTHYLRRWGLSPGVKVFFISPAKHPISSEKHIMNRLKTTFLPSLLAMFIAPLTGGSFLKLSSTRPPMEERIARLESRAC